MKRAPSGNYPGEFSFNSAKHHARYVATGEFRAPCKGEYYLSGAEIQACRAPNDLSSEYWIARPVEMETCKCCAGTGKTLKHAKLMEVR